MITTTLRKLQDAGLSDGLEALFEHFGKSDPDDEPFPLGVILEVLGLDYALWACSVEAQYDKEWRLFAVWCARRVEHLIDTQEDRHLLDQAERYALGLIGEGDLHMAKVAAWGVANDYVKDPAKNAAWNAIWATILPQAWDAAMSTASDAAQAIAWEAYEAASPETIDAVWDEAWDAERSAQAQEFLRIVTETKEREKNDHYHFEEA